MQPRIKEDFLHYLWRTKKIAPNNLMTTDGILIEVLDYGKYNTESGPDFFNAKVKIGDTLWVGNVEMHILSSDWLRHQHQHDKAYDNVILHVVYEHDASITLKNAIHPLPVLELKGKIPKSFFDNYQFLMASQDDIPCQSLIHTLDKDKINLWKYTLMVERLRHKSLTIEETFCKTNEDWEETLYITLARYFGAKTNTQPFEQMASMTPLSLVHKNRDKTTSLEALFYGQAGMLQAQYDDEYFQILKNEYEFLQKKYNLQSVNPVMWKFGRLRPINFPTVRIAQFVGLMQKVSFLFSTVQNISSNKDIQDIFQTEVNEYWVNHYRFGKTSPSLSKTLSSGFIDILIINAITPILYLYGKKTGQEVYIDKAITLLEDTKGENNNIIYQWKSLGLSAKSALDTQALLELKTHYCQEYKCLSCKIGHEILGKNPQNQP